MNCPKCGKEIEQLDAIDITMKAADTECEQCFARLHIEFELKIKSITIDDDTNN